MLNLSNNYNTYFLIYLYYYFVIVLRHKVQAMLLILTILLKHTTLQVLQFYLHDYLNWQCYNSLKINKIVGNQVLTVFALFYTLLSKMCIRSSQDLFKKTYSEVHVPAVKLISVMSFQKTNLSIKLYQ